MNTTVNELKAYYVKNGGQASDVVGIDTIPDMIAKITEISGGGSGGYGTFKINATMSGVTPGAGNQVTIDASYEDIDEAIRGGNLVYMELTVPGALESTSQIISAEEYEGVMLYHTRFTFITTKQDEIDYFDIRIQIDDSSGTRVTSLVRKYALQPKE